MYHSYFGLKEQVFSIAVDPHYLYMSGQHREALAHLLYGVDSGGFVLLTGEVGTGKTTIVRCLLEQLPYGTDMAIVLNPVASAPELLANICDEFGIGYEREEISIKVLMDKLYDYLLSNHTQGRNTVLLIDEAQLLRVSALEQVRLLTNLETNTRKLLQIILVGQPELNRLLAKPGLRQLSQRITARYHLRALTLEETQAYISHRLHVGGMKGVQRPFPPEIIRSIHRTSRGIPRLINVLCDRMLLGAYSQDKNQVDDAIYRQAAVEVLGEETPSAQPAKTVSVAPRWLYASGWGLAAGLAAIFVWQQWLVTMPPQADAAVIKTEQALPKAPAPAAVSFNNYSFSKADAALEELLRVLELSPVTAAAPCGEAVAYSCETDSLSTWSELLRLNRPVVLRLITPAKQEVFATLVGLDTETAHLQQEGKHVSVPLSELGPLWSGQVTYIWRKPAVFSEAVGLGAEGEVVEWIAARFAELDGQQERLARDRFTRELAERVKIFQREHQLQPDGIVGTRTLMALNQALGIDKTLQDFSSADG